MATKRRNRWLRVVLLVLLLAPVVAPLAGCRKIEALRGPGYPDAENDLGANLRPKKAANNRSPDRYFFDERASQIEEHLGL